MQCNIDHVNDNIEHEFLKNIHLFTCTYSIYSNQVYIYHSINIAIMFYSQNRSLGTSPMMFLL